MSARLAALLMGTVAPGVYRCRSRASVAAIAQRAAICGWRFVYLDGRRIAAKVDFLAACAAACGFPASFGRNWDALEDSLRDLSWLPAEHGYLVLYDSAGQFATAAPHEFAVALSILQGAVDYWQGTPTPMAALLRGLGRASVQLAEL
ncbi:MAG TPA: barstar family protein [Anaerolineae bacterium]|nr:barstar family protein [Anaerolineae bacterium]HOQ97385.1 barstar family protein [Anaerolineae bacterium]HPL30786.1 barstar family protein [Anaerolineae bacterium]